MSAERRTEHMDEAEKPLTAKEVEHLRIVAEGLAEDARDCPEPDCADHFLNVSPRRLLGLLATLDAARAAAPSDPEPSEWTANGLAAVEHLDDLWRAGEPDGISATDWYAAIDAIREAFRWGAAAPSDGLREAAQRVLDEAGPRGYVTAASFVALRAALAATEQREGLDVPTLARAIDSLRTDRNPDSNGLDFNTGWNDALDSILPRLAEGRTR